jgi:hypothetical protein
VALLDQRRTTMTKSDVGRGRPPKHSQFKPGISGNPKGRPKRRATALGEITRSVFNTSVEYRDCGRLKKSTRSELTLKAFVKRALSGSVAAAETLSTNAKRQVADAGPGHRLPLVARRQDHPNYRPPTRATVISATGHVWTAPGWQVLSSRMQQWSEQPCVRPVSAVHLTAGHNALRGSGPGHKHAFDNAVARVGCPDRRIDRLCITCCSPFPTVTSRRMSDAISFTPRVRRFPCSARL